MPDRPKSVVREWTVEQNARVLAEASHLDGELLSAYFERQGLKLSEYEQWRIALDEGGAASTATTKRIRELERELARKEKALAEAAALVVGRSPGAGLSPARHFGANHRALAC